MATNDDELDLEKLKKERGDLLDEEEDEAKKKQEALEEQEEEEEEEEEGKKKQEAEEEDEGKKRKVIPLDRHEAVLEKERATRAAAENRLEAVERELAAMSQKGEASKVIEELEAKADALVKRQAAVMVDGDPEKAAQLLREIRKIDRQIATLEVSANTERQTAAMLEQSRVEVVVARLEAEHPEFNPESAAYDESLTSFVISEQQRLIRTEGLAPSKALQRAGEYVVKRFLSEGENEGETEKKGLKVLNDRKKAAVERNLRVVGKQPAELKDVGVDSDKKGPKDVLPNVKDMTQEEFDALPEATRARMRGDFL